MTEGDLERFRGWLVKSERLSSTTARKAVSDVQTMWTHGPTPPHSEQLAARYRALRYAWALWADFCAAEGKRNTLGEPEKPPAPPPTNRRRRRAEKDDGAGERLRDAISVPVAEWKKFLRIVEQDATMPGRVIDVLCSSALRVSDVLRTPKSALTAAFAREDGLTTIKVKGAKPVYYSIVAAEQEWTRLYALLNKTRADEVVASAVSPGSGWDASSAAYQRCRRRLHELAAYAGIEDRIHLHRLRRTVAVLFTNETGNIFLTQKLLDHDDAATTKTYTDEANTLAVAKAMADFNRKMRGR